MDLRLPMTKPASLYSWSPNSKILTLARTIHQNRGAEQKHLTPAGRITRQTTLESSVGRTGIRWVSGATGVEALQRGAVLSRYST